MLIEIHAIQNHSPANLNRDDLGAPKTCYFGGVMRSRISSQCLKRSIRTSEQFKILCGGIRTRRLPQFLASQIEDKQMLPLAEAVVRECGLKEDKEAKVGKKDVIVFLSKAATANMVGLLRKEPAEVSDSRVQLLARQFAKMVADERFAPDMALSGRMLEPAKPPKATKGKTRNAGDEDQGEAESGSKAAGVWNGRDLRIEAALQVAHGISTHEARPEVDYFVAKDDIPGEDAGGAHIGEAMFASACFYKYFSIHWETLLKNLEGFSGNYEFLAAHTVGAFLRGVSLANPTGKQNSFAAHNPPDGIVVEVKKDLGTPISYANAFASPVPCKGPRDIVSQSIAQLGQYIHDLDTGYGKMGTRFWFSPNLRHELRYIENEKEFSFEGIANQKSLGDLVTHVVAEIGYDWAEVQKVTVQ
jgi:CRISPR system Cascade subunit CasC